MRYAYRAKRKLFLCCMHDMYTMNTELEMGRTTADKVAENRRPKQPEIILHFFLWLCQEKK